MKTNEKQRLKNVSSVGPSEAVGCTILHVTSGISYFYLNFAGHPCA